MCAGDEGGPQVLMAMHKAKLTWSCSSQGSLGRAHLGSGPVCGPQCCLPRSLPLSTLPPTILLFPSPQDCIIALQPLLWCLYHRSLTLLSFWPYTLFTGIENSS